MKTLESLFVGTPEQVFSCEFCEIFKNTFFTENVWATASQKSSEK